MKIKCLCNGWEIVEAPAPPWKWYVNENQGEMQSISPHDGPVQE
jgi:hypothetical protein